jgi:hypothetical protein
MRALFSIVSLLVVVAVIAISAKHQLAASRQLVGAPASSAADAAAPFGGASQPTPAQFKRELERTLNDGAAGRASDVESAEAQR